MSDYTATAILTEHLEFPPVSLIDDVINAVNDIMYKCTQAMETYLTNRQKNLSQNKPRKTNKEKTLEKQQLDEIQVGTAKLETLLENEVSKNFDKFELYTLRNLLHIPEDLVRQGWFRLEHHSGLQFDSARMDNAKLDSQIEFLLKDIQLELQLRKLLKLQLVKAKAIIKTLKSYRKALEFLKEPIDSEARSALKSVSPLNENLYYILSQADELFTNVQNIIDNLNNSSPKKFVPTKRESYINGKSIKLLESLGVLETGKDQEQIPLIKGIISNDQLNKAKIINEGL